MAIIPRKTYPELTAQTTVADSDLIATYRSPGPLKKLTALIFGTWVVQTLTAFVQDGIGAISRTFLAKGRDTLDVRDFGVTTSGDNGAAIQAALTEAVTSGKELVWPGGSYTSNQALSCGAVKMRAQGPVTITYGSSTHIGRFVEISSGGAGDVVFAGDFTIDGNNKANIGVTIINENATARKLSIGNLTGRNCKMVTGSAFNAGSIGVNILGNWSLIQANRLAASAINRDAGTAGGTLSTIGVQAGITAGYGPLVIDVDILEVSDISCGDAAGAAQRIDVDGAFFAQLDVTGASCRVGQLLANNCVGRSYKNQSYRSNVLEAASVTRTVESITGGGADIDFQFATGVLGQADFYYSGSANLGDGVTPVSYFTATSRTRYGPVETGPVTVIDATGGAETINQIISCRNSSGTSVALRYDIGPVAIFGKAAKCLVDIGASGSVGNCSINFAGFSGVLTYSVIKNNASPNNLDAMYIGVQNTGSEIPTIKRDDAAPLGNFSGRHWDQGGNVGLAINRGADAAIPGLAPPGTTFTIASLLNGRVPLYAATLASGATVELPAFGLTASTGIVTIVDLSGNEIGRYKVTGGSNTITTDLSATTIVAGSGGADPGSGTVRIWMTSSASRMTVKNTAGDGRFLNIYADM